MRDETVEVCRVLRTNMFTTNVYVYTCALVSFNFGKRQLIIVNSRHESRHLSRGRDLDEYVGKNHVYLGCKQTYKHICKIFSFLLYLFYFYFDVLNDWGPIFAPRPPPTSFKQVRMLQKNNLSGNAQLLLPT